MTSSAQTLSVERTFPCQVACPFFVEVPIVDQLRKLFLKPGFYKDTQFCQNRGKRGERICDIYDGELYKKLSQPPDVLSNP